MDLYAIRNALMAGKSIYDLELTVTYYTRVSTKTEEQQNSLKNQTEYFEVFIKGVAKWTFVEGYIDSGISGTATTKRMAFNRMIEDGRNKKFDLILTKEISRFSRNTLDSLFYTRELLKHGVGVFFLSDNIHTLLPDSELRLTIMSSIAQEESRKISERTKFGKQKAIGDGIVMCNGRFWGYDRDGDKLTINEEEAKMIRKIFDMYCNNIGVRTIAKKLTEEGYINHNGRPFAPSTIRGILANPRYKGYYTAKKTVILDYMTKQRKNIPPEEWLVYPAPKIIPPIVTEEIWDEANKLMKKKSSSMKAEDSKSYQNKYLYSGKIYCGEHNKTYWRTLFKYDTIEDKEIWQCKVYRVEGKKGCDNPMIYKHELDDIVKYSIKEIFGNKEYHINKLIDMYKKHIQDIDYDKDIKELMNKTMNIEKKKDKILELNIESRLSNEEFEKKNNQLNEEIELLDQQIKQYESLNDAKYDAEKQIKMISNFLDKNMDFVNANEVSDEIVASFLDKIVINKGSKENEMVLDITLKPAIPIKAIYRKDIFNNLQLYLTTHMARYSCKFIYARNCNNIKNKPYNVSIHVNVSFNLI